jgi:hypothetical protein
MPFVIDDVAEVIAIMTIFPQPVVLSYPLTRVIVGQMSVATDQCCCFTLGSFSLILRSVTTRGLTPMVTDCWCHCGDVARCLNPLLG